MNTNGIAENYVSQIIASDKTTPVAKVSKKYGKQIGEPQLSEKAEKYYLHMDFPDERMRL